ncbi:MAG: potassium transporter Kup [Gammaproteobacteria bacterium]|jgi:KUP system potassium uptake protein|nr:potassium transporter Kup [Gammaproteobacteria bacterium]
MRHRVDKSPTAALTLAALGVVYGDIGTSPLYTLHEAFAGGHHPVPVTPENVLGILSLVFWALMLVVTLKYAAFILRADNHGEGGIMALMALAQHSAAGRSRPLTLLGLFGAALFFGDGAITPAISVLSAVEGLEVATPSLRPWVLPIAIGVLLALFRVQERGTGRVGRLFGPITAAWLLVLATLGIAGIVQVPRVLEALSPAPAIAFFGAQPGLAFLSLGAVILAVTGAEALYADMGHFGPRPVRLAWFGLALPALTLNYFGQGALLLADPSAVENPFYRLAPSWALYPLVVLATAATVIASQAVISGVYSITHQAIQLGFAPWMRVQHTSSRERGQIYLPGVNWALFVAVVVLVLTFGSSDRLGAAYGVAVAGTMGITTVLVYQVARRQWGWSRMLAVPVLGGLLLMDGAFFAANLAKIGAGGWFPLAFGAVVFTLMATWRRGRELVSARRDGGGTPLEAFVADLSTAELPTVRGTAVYLTPRPEQVPHPLLHSIKHYKCLHEQVVILGIGFADTPFVPTGRRLQIEPLGGRFYRVRALFGFMDRPNLTRTLHTCAVRGIVCDPTDTTFILGRETLIPNRQSPMAYWRQKLFIAMTRNAAGPGSYFGLPPNRVVELGAQLEL